MTMRIYIVFCFSCTLSFFLPMGWGETLPVPVDRTVGPNPPRTPVAEAVPPARVRGAGEQPAAPQARWTAPTARVVDDSPAPPPVRWAGAPASVEPNVASSHDQLVPRATAEGWAPADARPLQLHPQWSTQSRPRLLENRPVVRMPFREETIGLALEDLSMQDFNRYVFRRNHSSEPGAVPRQRAGRADR